MAARYFEKEEHVRLYQQYRVNPPAQLQQSAVNYLKEKYEESLKLAVDVGCGNGQNTWGYSQYFDKVLGLDVSPNQIAVAIEQKSLKTDCQNVEFRISAAEKLEFLEENSVQLVTASSAAHWFDLPVFLAEVVRILAPNGVLALSSFKRPTLLCWDKNPDKNEKLTYVLENATKDVLLPYKAANIQLSTNRYTDLERLFPSELGDVQRFEDQFFSERRMSIEDLVGRKKTSSMYQRYLEDKGQDAAEKLLSIMREKLRAVLADDLEGHEKSTEIFVTEETPFFAIFCRKVPNYP